MKISTSSVIRIHLRVSHGIHVKSCSKKREGMFTCGSKIFGTCLENVPRRYIAEYGLVPCFLVDACSILLERIATVGLFRKPGSVARMKTLRAKLNRGEGWPPTAVPYDVASLLKQFCRELPDPLFPSELHGALLKAQALPTVKERTSAIQLLSCLLPARNFSFLQYLFDFLSKVSKRCDENLMTSSNLAVVFAPCLLPPSNKEEMADKCFQHRVNVLRIYIENAHLFGTVPKAVMDSIPFLLGSGHSKTSHSKGRSRERLRQVATKAPMRPKMRSLSVSDGSISTRPLRRSLGLETFPNILLFRTCTFPTDPDRCHPAAAMPTSMSVGEETYRIPLVKPKRVGLDASGYRSMLVSGVDPGSSPVLAKIGKLNLTSWRRRSAP